QTAGETKGRQKAHEKHRQDQHPPGRLHPGAQGAIVRMRYRLEIKEEARRQLRALSKEQRRRIGGKLDAVQEDLAGDVKKLSVRTHEYRLRIGSFRVLFTLERDLISVYRVRDRRDVYE